MKVAIQASRRAQENDVELPGMAAEFSVVRSEEHLALRYEIIHL